MVTPWPGLSLPWRHNGRNGISNYQPHDYLLNRSFRRRSKKISKLRLTDLCAGNSPVTGEFPAQVASNAENVFIWWRHHDGHTNFILIAFIQCQSGVIQGGRGHTYSKRIRSNNLPSIRLVFFPFHAPQSCDTTISKFGSKFVGEVKGQGHIIVIFQIWRTSRHSLPHRRVQNKSTPAGPYELFLCSHECCF